MCFFGTPDFAAAGIAKGSSGRHVNKALAPEAFS